MGKNIEKVVRHLKETMGVNVGARMGNYIGKTARHLNKIKF